MQFFYYEFVYMQIMSLLTSERVLVEVEICNKKRALELLSTMLAEVNPELDSQEILQAFIERERLGCTAIGHGVALPHIRAEYIDHPYLAVLKLNAGIDFENFDESTVDIFFGLIVPSAQTEEHLALLARIAGLMSIDTNRRKLRACTSSHDLFQSLSNIDEQTTDE